MKAAIFLFLVFIPVSAFCQHADSAQVLFARNDAQISKQSAAILDKLDKKISPNTKLTILGYADYIGNSAHNDSLANMRAKNVADYLMSKGWSKPDINSLGKGQIERRPNGLGYPEDRKVLVITSKIVNEPKVTQFDISKMKAGETIALTNILFENATSKILQTSFPELEHLLKIMQENKTLCIQLEGHICCLDPNMKPVPNDISFERAHAVYNYLLLSGINENRLRFTGFAATRRLNSEITEEQRQQNRRVEIRILSK